MDGRQRVEKIHTGKYGKKTGKHKRSSAIFCLNRWTAVTYKTHFPWDSCSSSDCMFNNYYLNCDFFTSGKKSWKGSSLQLWASCEPWEKAPWRHQQSNIQSIQQTQLQSPAEMPAYLTTHTKNICAIWSEIPPIIAASLPTYKECICLLIKRLFKNSTKALFNFVAQWHLQWPKMLALLWEKNLLSMAWWQEWQNSKAVCQGNGRFQKEKHKGASRFIQVYFFLWDCNYSTVQDFFWMSAGGFVLFFFLLPLLESISCWHQTDSHYTFLVMSMKSFPDVFLHCIAHLDLNRETYRWQKAQGLHNDYAISCSIKITVYLQKSI